VSERDGPGWPAGGAGGVDGPAQAGSPPMCYRHPGRETYVRCSRCDRPICPDCMVAAAVGFQCPECVRLGNRGGRSARTAFGGRLVSDTALVTKALIAANVLIFLAAQVAGGSFVRDLWLVGVDALDGNGVAQGGVYRLLSAAFLHQQVLHIGFNMLGLWMFGPALEALLGRSRFLALYVLGALVGSATSYALNPPFQPSLGASGAIFGVVGAFFAADRRLRGNLSGIVIYLAVLLVPGFILPGIDWHAHVGGLLAGLVLGGVYAYAPRSHRTGYHVAAAVVILAVVAVVVAVRTTQLGY
jgi:membrane associated rhomboid family serine protease